jgi:hypothetical protein
MPTSLTVAGTTRLAWSLSDSQSAADYSASGEDRTSRAISNGTGVGAANVAASKSITGTQAGFSMSTTGITGSVLGTLQTANVATVRELLVQVPTGPTGGFLTVTHPGISGVRVGVGGQLHFADYAGGITGGTLAFATSVTGTYGVDVTAVGVGTYS